MLKISWDSDIMNIYIHVWNLNTNANLELCTTTPTKDRHECDGHSPVGSALSSVTDWKISASPGGVPLNSGSEPGALIPKKHNGDNWWLNLKYFKEVIACTAALKHLNTSYFYSHNTSQLWHTAAVLVFKLFKHTVLLTFLCVWLVCVSSSFSSCSFTASRWLTSPRSSDTYNIECFSD